MVKSKPKKTRLPHPFKGRIGRLQFFFGFLYILLIFTADVIAGGLDQHVFKRGPVYTSIAYITSIIAIFILLFAAIEFTALYIRRLHDHNYSGLLALIILVPVVDLLLILFLQFAPGDADVNQYGELPSDGLDALTVWGLRR